MKELLLGILLPVALFLGCDNNTPQAKIIVIDKKVVLEQWPEESYIAALDSVLAAEPIKKQKEITTNITMNAHSAPIFKLPETVTGVKEKPNQGSKSSEVPKAIKEKPKVNAENFVSQFTTALSKLQSDPSNSSLYKTVTVKQNEDINQLLKRTYGQNPQNLPRFYVLSGLQSVNPNVLIEHLKEGDKVRLPAL